MPKNISAPPYFDDFDQSKNFQQILFKPGFAVQTRELNQLQTIQQSQVERFGNSIYANGSVVSGGATFINQKAISVKLVDSYNGVINVDPLSNKYAKGRTSGAIGEILLPIKKTDTDPNTLVYQARVNGSTGGLFQDSELIDIFNDQDCTNPYNVTVKAATSSINNTTGQCNKFDSSITVASSSGIAIGDRVVSQLISFNTYVTDVVGNKVFVNNKLNFDIPAGTPFSFSKDVSVPTVLVSIAEGVYFVDGYFLHVNPQTIILDKYSNSPSYIVGLYHNTEIVTVDEDSTLLDNASGSYNYAAPGADRLTIPLILDKIPLTDDSPEHLTDNNFFELIRINNGAVLTQNNYPIYSELQKTLSRRTYEESGDFLVRPFILNLEDDTKYDTALLAEISEGKAYVRGNEIEKISSTDIRIDRSRATESVSSYEVGSYYGSYTKVGAPTKSFPQIGNGLTVEIHNVTTGYSSSTKIGTANVRYMSYDSGSGSSIIYKLFLFNIVLSGSNTFAAARSFITTATAGVYTTITTEMRIDAGSIVSGNASLYDSSFQSMLFDIPQTFIQTVTKTSYSTKRVYKGINFSGGIATITTNGGNEQFLGGSGVISGSSAIANFSVVATSSAGATTAGSFIPMDGSGRSVTIPVVSAGNPGQAQININDAGFNGTADIEATIFVNGDARRVKTLVSGFQKNVVAPTSTISLLKADVYKIDAIYDSGNPSVAATTSSTDVTANYILDNGQRDTHYDHASIRLKTGASAPTGQLLIVFDYFTHSGGNGYISVDSYSVGYTNIPSYTDSKGVIHQLRDCLDFRPRRVDDNSNLVFQGFQLPDPTQVAIDQSYYLSRIDKIVLSASGQIKVLTGISSFQNPQPPTDLPDAMTMYTLVLPAYTQYASDVKVIYENNRRYTMKDIANIDKRLANVEYYTALNSLEQSVLNSTQVNPSGVKLFQNGLLTDPFTDFTVGDVGNIDFKCSIDTVRNIARAPYQLENCSLVWNQTGSTSAKTGDLVTSPYIEKLFVSQNLATKYINVNPYNVLSNIGYLKLTPTSDVWYDTKTLPVITVNNDNTAAFAVAQEQASASNQNAGWGAWETNWTGVADTVQGTVTTTTSSRYKTVTSVSSNTVTSADTVIVSKDVVPYVREKDVAFDVTGLVPFSKVYAWMDGINISGYVTPDIVPPNLSGVTNIVMVNSGHGYTSAPSVALNGGDGSGATAFAVVNADGSITVKITTFGTGYTIAPNVVITGGGGTGAVATAQVNIPVRGMQMVTDRNGRISGTLHIPNDSQNKFISGSKRIIISDNTDTALNSTSYADAQFLSQGYINNSQTTITSTRVPVLVTSSIEDNQTTSSVTSPRGSTDYGYYTPTYGVGGSKTFLDSDQSAADVAAKIADSTGVSLSHAQDVLNKVITAYNTTGAATPIRTVGDQHGLPDINGAEFWAVNSIKNGDPDPTKTVSNAIVAARSSGTEGAIPNLNAGGTIGQCILDPLAETFFIDAERNPQGVFISSIDLFFASKDATNPVIIELRPTVNGYPSSSVIIPFSQFALTPDLISTSTDGSAKTNCKFPSPVFLAPGEYAIVIKSNSNKYNLFVAELGKALIGQTKAVTEQPYVGSLFQSQNASTWSASQELDLCFNLYKCEFSVGTTKFYLNALLGDNAVFNYDIANITSQELGFGNATDISAKIASSPLSGTGLGGFKSILLNSNYNFSTRQTMAVDGDLQIEYTLTTRSIDVSPVIDLERSSAILVQNVINQQSDWSISETSTNGDAKAKYISKKVTLQQGFDADNLVVYVDVNRPAGTSIQVYYKAQNVFDNTDFTALPWILMNNEVNGGNTSTSTDTVEDKYSAYNISYVNAGTTYNNFRTFQVKVVMLSSNPSYSPSITDVRELALA